MATLKHYGKIINGKKKYYNIPLHDSVIHSLEGKEFEEIIREKNRS